MSAELLNNTPLFLTGVFLMGLLFGSFLNVLILRLPAKMEHEWKCQCRELLELKPGLGEPPPGIMWGRSYCPKCNHQITALENIPVLSYLFLRGRCSDCKTRISLRYPVVELATALLLVGAAVHFGPTIQFAAAAVLTLFLVALTGIDIDHHLLPDNMTLLLLWIGLALSLFGVFTDPVGSITGAMVGYLSLWLVFHMFRIATGKEGMGFGDFKLLAAFGAWFGWGVIPLIIVMSSVVGAVVGIVLMVARVHKKDQPLPFGPFIAAAGWIAMVWGDQIIDSYLRISGMG